MRIALARDKKIGYMYVYIHISDIFLFRSEFDPIHLFVWDVYIYTL